MLQPVDISSGQVSGVDNLSLAASSVLNWEADESGINRPRAALATYSVTGLTTAKIIGMERWSGYTVLVDANRKFQYINDVSTTLAVDASTSTVTTQLQGVKRPTWVVGKQYIYAAGGGQIQRWNNTIGLTETLTSSPFNATHIASLGQYLISNDLSDPNQYKWSDIGETAWTSWPSGNSSAADARPDNITALLENANRLYIFGDQSLQIYELGSDPTLPFDLIGSTDTGLAAPYAYARLDTELGYLDNRRRIVIGDGVNVRPISDAIQKDLRGLTTVSDCHIYREEVGQQSNLVVRFPTETRTFVYDLRGEKWRERDSYVAPFHADYPSGAYVYRRSDNTHIIASSRSTGGLYTLSTSSRQDLGGALVCERTTGWHDFGTANRKRSNGLVLVSRRGTAAQGATPAAYEVRAQPENGPWSPWEFVSVGTPSDYEQKQKVRIHGVFTRRRYGIRVSGSEDTSLVSLHDDVTDLGMV
jgi:hypothetical protein